jgi:hypothetical protein
VRLTEKPIRAELASGATGLRELLSDPDPARAAGTEAMLGMRKLVVAELDAAADAVGE